MKNLMIHLTCCILLAACSNPISHNKSAIVQISGNCGMCEKTIEEAGQITGICDVDWSQETKQAKIQFDSSKTNQSEILKRIADAGYDNEMHQATNSAYESLHECCHYERNTTTPSTH
jgi:copper chaperone CopZ